LDCCCSRIYYPFSLSTTQIVSQYQVIAYLVFTPPFVLNALHLLVDKLLPLTSTDLEALSDEPEEWLIAESNDEEAWAFEFRVSETRASADSSHVPNGYS
jgi:hypothetical protein